MIGERFTRLTVKELHSRDRNYNRRWLCTCDCGNDHIVLHHKLLDGSVKSCGCLKAEFDAMYKAMRDDDRRKYTRRSYNSMVCRCVDPRAPAWGKYGAKGITVCDRWLHGESGKSGWECFYEDMGPRAQDLSIDRIDGTKGYFKENCRWATQAEQSANRRPRRKKEA